MATKTRIVGRAPALVALLLCCGALAGCGAPAASLISPAVSGVPAVAEFLDGDRSESYWVARPEDVVAAARTSAGKFGLEPGRDDANAERILLVFSDRSGETVRLRIEARTEALTFVRFHAESGMARLFSRQMAEELVAADAFLVDWDGEPGAFSR